MILARVVLRRAAMTTPPAPLLLPALSFLVGEAAGIALLGDCRPWLLLAAITTAAFTFARGALRPLLLAVVFLALGIARAAATTPSTPPSVLCRSGWFDVVLKEDGRADADGIDVIVTGLRTTPEGSLRWEGRWPARMLVQRWPTAAGPGTRNERWRVPGTLRPPGRRAIDPRPWVRASPGKELVRLRAAPSWNPTGWIDDLVLGLQARLRFTIEHQSPADMEPLFRALVVGDRDSLGGRWEDRFSRTGTVHLLSISGLHVTATGVPAAWLLRWLLRRGPTELVATGRADDVAVLGALGMALIYVLAAGGPIPAWRSWAMLAAAAGARMVDRKMPSWNVLAVAALAVGIADASAVQSLGFQLSFLSVAGLLAAADVVGPWLEGRPRWIRAVGLLLAASAGSFLATTPRLALAFDVVAPAALWANLVAIPLLGEVTMLPLLIGSALGSVYEPLGVLLLWIASWPARLGMAAIAWFAEPSRCPLWPWEPSAGLVGAFYVAGALPFVRRHTDWGAR